MNFWSIKRVQTRGIVKYDGCEEKVVSDDASYASRDSGNYLSTDHVFERVGVSCFRTKDEAIEHAIGKVERMIASLERRREKLKSVLWDLSIGGTGAPKKRTKG